MDQRCTRFLVYLPRFYGATGVTKKQKWSLYIYIFYFKTLAFSFEILSDRVNLTEHVYKRAEFY